ncbi:MAG: YdcF family protein [Pseudomonadota bacterium]
MSHHLIVILGAAVRPDGLASAALRRRIEGGLRLALAHPDAMVFCSGGVGRYGPPEASIMAERLTSCGVSRERLILDEQSLDTLQTVVAATREIGRRRLAGAIVCTDSYHTPRTRLIFAALGVPSLDGSVKAGPRQMGWPAWWRMRLREVPAIPYDWVLALTKRRGLRDQIGSTL